MRQYIVDAFTDTLFAGNQAAVVVAQSWPSGMLMQRIAKENNFSETAFTVRESGGWHLRWFTLGGEIDFCGHATLATSFVLLTQVCPEEPEVRFITKRGDLSVRKDGGLFVMDFPAYECTGIPVTDQMEKALGVRPKEAYIDRDLLLVLDDEVQVRALTPDLARVATLPGLLCAVTAPSATPQYDCVSRVFAPRLGVAEDPVTGSAHCMIAPYWARRLGKERITAYQASERGGTLHATCRSGSSRVQIAGNAVLFAVAELTVSE